MYKTLLLLLLLLLEVIAEQYSSRPKYMKSKLHESDRERSEGVSRHDVRTDCSAYVCAPHTAILLISNRLWRSNIVRPLLGSKDGSRSGIGIDRNSDSLEVPPDGLYALPINISYAILHMHPAQVQCRSPPISKYSRF